MKHSEKTMKRLCVRCGVSMAVLFCMAACGNKQVAILGDWVTTDSTGTYGFSLGHHGLAATLGHPQVQYTKWSLGGNRLILQGKYYHSGVATTFCDTLVLTEFSTEEMTAWNKDMKTTYRRPDASAL